MLKRLKTYCENKTNLFAACIVIISFMLTNCATTSTSLKFTQSEVKLIPVVAIQKVLSPASTNETVKVWAKGISEPAEVKGCEGQKYVIVRDERNKKEMKLPINDITEIEHIWRYKKSNSFGSKYKGNTAGAVAETAFYAPMVPVSIAMWPVLRISGLDAKKNAEDNSKARLVYEGISKNDLLTYIGKPTEKYLCSPKEQNRWSKKEEVWVYRKDQVLRGGRSLFIDLDNGQVYYNSYDTSFFKNRENCSLIK
jgi:hypothetical protein